MARTQTPAEQQRSVSRREQFSFPSLGGDLFTWSPFAFLREMTDWMDRSVAGGHSSGNGQTSMWSPALEVRQKDNNLIVCADLPGVDPQNVKLEVDNDMLVIQGERRNEHTEERHGVHRTERSYGTFYRSIPLPEGAKIDQAKAEYRNGVLEVTVPCEQPKSSRRQIQIQGAGSSQSTQAAQAGTSQTRQAGTPQRGQGGSVQR